MTINLLRIQAAGLRRAGADECDLRMFRLAVEERPFRAAFVGLYEKGLQAWGHRG